MKGGMEANFGPLFGEMSRGPYQIDMEICGHYRTAGPQGFVFDALIENFLLEKFHIMLLCFKYGMLFHFKWRMNHLLNLFKLFSDLNFC
jgi:hypothetical protein